MTNLASESTRLGAQRRYSFSGNLFLSLVLIGYPLSVVTGQMLALDASQANIIFRALMIAFALVLALWTIARGQFRPDVLIFLFLALYTTRMIADFAYSGLPSIERDLQFYLATVLIPVLAMGGANYWYDEKLCLRLIAVLGGVAGVGIIYLLLFQADQILIETMGDRAAFEALNPISISYHGLYVLAVSALLIFDSSGEKRRLLLWGAAAAVGGYLLFAGGSRGPIVALVVALGLTGMANVRNVRIYGLLGVLVTALLVALGAPELVLQRFVSLGGDASSLERFEVANLSIELAINHPLGGYSYVEPLTGNYPHNLLIESALALGLGGAALMLLIQVSLVTRAWRLARHGEWLLPFLGAIILTNAWISGSIWGSGPFFVLAFMLRLRGQKKPTADALQHRNLLDAAQ